MITPNRIHLFKTSSDAAECCQNGSALMQISETFNEPRIIIQAWPANQQLAGVLDGDDGVSETVQYLLAMPSLCKTVRSFLTHLSRRLLTPCHVLCMRIW